MSKMTPEALLTVHGVTQKYGDAPVIESASFSLKPGEVLCLTGPSGVGKSTLLEIAAGVLRPDAGIVTRGGKAALMFQDDVLIPWLNAEEAILYILPDSLDKKESQARARHWLTRFGLQGGQRPAAMSGGMRRRLSLARTFAAARPLIFLDEPFAFLDIDNQRIVAEEIAAHAAKGCGIMLTSHATDPLSLSDFGQTPLRVIPVEQSPVIIS